MMKQEGRQMQIRGTDVLDESTIQLQLTTQKVIRHLPVLLLLPRRMKQNMERQILALLPLFLNAPLLLPLPHLSLHPPLSLPLPHPSL